MFGDDATRLLRQRGFGAPILGVTGDALSADLRLFQDAGASDVGGVCAGAHSTRNSVHMRGGVSGVGEARHQRGS